MSIPLATLAQARREAKKQSNDTVDDNYLLEALRVVSDRIEEKTGLNFTPYYDTRYFDSDGAHIDDFYGTLDLGYPLLAATAVTDAAGNALVYGTDYIYRPKGQQGHYWQLRLLSARSWSYTGGLSIINGWIDAISVTGLWGYRKWYTREGWLLSGDTVLNSGGFSGSITSITIANANGADGMGVTPRFSPGNLIGIDDTSSTPVRRFYEIISVSANNLTLTVRSNANESGTGTIAQNAPIYTWQPDPQINRAALRWVGYMYSRRASFENVRLDGAGTSAIVFPTDMPGEVANILEQVTDTNWSVV